LATGKTTPPARAPLDGTMDASSVSVATSEYASPMERLPNVRMKTYAMRRPSPVLSTARDMKKAHSTSQTIGSA
jgi:hypothetical protein